jgi:hypothetical protein
MRECRPEAFFVQKLYPTPAAEPVASHIHEWVFMEAAY